MSCPREEILTPMVHLIAASEQPGVRRLHALSAIKQAFCADAAGGDLACGGVECQRWEADVLAGMPAPVCPDCEEQRYRCSDHQDRLRMAVEARSWPEAEQLLDEIGDRLIRERAAG